MARIDGQAQGRLWLLIALALMLALTGGAAAAQPTGLAAVLEVLDAGVEVRRVDTANWVAVAVESIVGAGDSIRTDATGRARITFFADGTDTELQPNTDYRIDAFEGSDQAFTLTVAVLLGETTQRIGRALGADSAYDVITPAMTLAARGTIFTVRVQDTGRSAMLTREGEVSAGKEDDTAPVPADFGIRADVAGELSEVVPAATFGQLDAALDGCVAAVANVDDISYNVRVSPDAEAVQIGVLAPALIERVFGVTETTGWYRVAFDDTFGWIRAANVDVADDCAGLRVFMDDHEQE